MFDKEVEIIWLVSFYNLESLLILMAFNCCLLMFVRGYTYMILFDCLLYLRERLLELSAVTFAPRHHPKKKQPRTKNSDRPSARVSDWILLASKSSSNPRASSHRPPAWRAGKAPTLRRDQHQARGNRLSERLLAFGSQLRDGFQRLFCFRKEGRFSEPVESRSIVSRRI